MGEGTRVWGFAHVLSGARLGTDCNICAHVFIENDVVVGDRVTVKPGVQLYDGVRLDDDVFVGPNATFTNDPFPRSRKPPPEFARTVVRQGASIGANATILPGIEIGSGAMVGAGAVVTRSVPPNAIVVGNPARIVGYVDAMRAPLAEASGPVDPSEAVETSVAGVSLRRLPVHRDLRGSLTAAEFPGDVPFAPRRFFLVFAVPSAEVRGAHAHRLCEQFLVCVNGSVSVMVDDGDRREEFLLDSQAVGVHIPAMVWAVQYKYTPDAVLLVFASRPYEPDDYIRDYNDFLALRRGHVA